MRIVLLGAPGSGKGTQGEKLMTHFSIPKTSTGDALRAAVKAGTAMGIRAKAAMDAGELVADQIVIGIVEERLAQPDAQVGCIFDGFPRNTVQALALEGILKRLNQPEIDKALHLHVDDEEIVQRLVLRAKKEGRMDDREEVVRHRIEVYNAETQPLIAYYRRQSKLVKVEGIGEVGEIFERVLSVL